MTTPPIIHDTDRAEHDWRAALDLIRQAGSRFNRLGAQTSLPEALRLIAETAVQLIGPGASAVIYLFDAERNAFDRHSRVSAGEAQAVTRELQRGGSAAGDDYPRPNGVGMAAIRSRDRVLSYESGRPFHPLKHAAGIRTAACYPLLVGEQAVGALYLDLRDERRFTEDELRMLDTLVALAAVAIYNTRQFEGVNRALERKVAELTRLQDAASLISSRRNLDDTLAQILNSALALIGGEFGSFRLMERKSNVLRLITVSPAQNTEEDTPLPVEEAASVMSWVAYHRHTARIGDLNVEPWRDIYRPLLPDRLMRSELAVPIFGPGNSLLGVLNVESPRPHAFSPDDQSAIEAFAAQASIAIQEAQLLLAIVEITDELARRSPSQLLDLLIERACDLLNVAHAAVWEVDRATADMLVLRSANFDSFSQYRVPIRGSLLGEALKTRKPIYTADMSTDPLITRRRLSTQLRWVSAVVMPLIGRDGVPRGAFGVYSQTPRVFNDWEMRLLTALANHAAVAFQQAEALAQVKLAQERQAVAETFAVLGDVAANLIHRVNNMVGVIPALTQSLTEKRPDLLGDPVAAKKLADIAASARQAMTTARESVAYLRPFQIGPVSVKAAYTGAVQRIERPENIQISSVGLGRLPLVLAGEEQLRLVLVNLIENAIEALGDGPGRIVTRGQVVSDILDPTTRWVELVVSDSGPGVPEEVRDRIFDATFSTRGGGRKLGFGLWWVKSWVQRFGGSIVLAEQTPNSRQSPMGCTFVIRLPPAKSEG